MYVYVIFISCVKRTPHNNTKQNQNNEQYRCGKMKTILLVYICDTEMRYLRHNTGRKQAAG